MSADKELKVGGDILSFCGKCKEPRNHTILSLTKKGTVDRCECTTCGAAHKYRDPEKVAKKGAAKKTVKKATPEEAWKKAVGGASGPAKPYMMSGEYAAEDLIDHPTFGQGFVEESIVPNKIRVIFEEGAKVLIHKQ